jgi:hypothetical protein
MFYVNVLLSIGRKTYLISCDVSDNVATVKIDWNYLRNEMYLIVIILNIPILLFCHYFNVTSLQSQTDNTKQVITIFIDCLM